MKESAVHDIVNSDINVKMTLLEVLGGKTENSFEYINEDRFPKGMIVDYTLIYEGVLIYLD